MSSAPPPPPPYAEKNYYQQAPPPMAQPGYVGPPMGQPGYIGPTMLVVGEYPVQCTCPQCRNQVVTRTEKKSGLLTWLVCAGLFVIGCWPCYFIPFCVDACKDTEHYCPSCNAFIGKSKVL